MSKIKIILASIIGILIIGLSVLTYAFFNAKIEGQAEFDNVVQTTGTLSIEYIEGQNISAEKIRPGWSGIKTFTIKNNGTLPASYEIVFDDVINTFINDEVLYSGTCISDQSTCEDITPGVISKEQQLLKGSISIEPNEEHSYEIKIEFIETGKNQDYNNQAVLSGKILIYDSDSFRILKLKDEFEGKQYLFSYTGNIQSFDVPVNGVYQLETWGAQGGRSNGARGGYASGEVDLNKDQRIFIVVGGAGVETSYMKTAIGGYNGGGNSVYSDRNSNSTSGSGGGATHIAKRSNLLRYLSSASQRADILIVAGGGGGGGRSYGSGVGGGLQGLRGDGKAEVAGFTYYGGGGSQTTGGTLPYDVNRLRGSDGGFGYGGEGSGDNSSYSYYVSGGGGGGGYYGGGGGKIGDYVSSGGGGGGSSYIGGLNNARTVAGNAAVPRPTGTGTQVGNTGNGYARITIVKVKV